MSRILHRELPRGSCTCICAVGRSERGSLSQQTQRSHPQEMSLSVLAWCVYDQLEKLAIRHGAPPLPPFRPYSFAGSKFARCKTGYQHCIHSLRTVVAFELFDLVRKTKSLSKHESATAEDVELAKIVGNSVSSIFWVSHLHRQDPARHGLPFPKDVEIPANFRYFDDHAMALDDVSTILERGVALVENMLELRDVNEMLHELEGIAKFRALRATC